MLHRSAYRPDIDGLRAIAVLAVLLYHYGAAWLPGGFTGVDVFFVISGFVITLKLRREIEAGEFSILGFYDGRVRRILPAALVAIGVSLVAGYLLLLPGDYASLGKSAAYASAGLGNLFFFWNTGYFDQVSGLQPLLHFWSLGVEEQFYLVWPVALWLALSSMRARPRLLLSILTAATVFAFAFAVWEVSYDPKAAFYLPQFRAWELSLGALLVFVPAMQSKALAQIAAALGVALVAFSFLSIREADPFPGFNAAYACVGAALLIWPKTDNILTNALSRPPMLFIGKISYSLYLWHWPVWVFYRHYSNGIMPSWPEAIGLGIMAFALAACSWRFIEKPFRRPFSSRIMVVGAGLAAVAVIALAGNVVWSNGGFLQRTSTSTEPLRSLSAMWQWDCPNTIDLPGIGSNCVFGAPWDKSTQKVLLWGDSHAEHMAPLLQVYAETHNASVVLYRACSPALDDVSFIPSHFEYPEYDVACGTSHRAVVDLLAQHPEIDTVVLASQWSSIADTIVGPDRERGPRSEGIDLLKAGVQSTLTAVSGPGRKVFLIGTVPIWASDPVPCAIAEAAGLLRKQCKPEDRSITRLQFDERQADEYAALRGAASAAKATLILPGDALCDSQACSVRLNGEFLYRDISHIRRNLQPATLKELAGIIGINAIFEP